MTNPVKSPICEFKNINAINLRKRFDVHLFLSHLELHGRSVDLKVDYKNIKQISVLPKNVLVHVVLSLDTPLKSGKVNCSHVAFRFDQKKKLEVVINLTKTRRDALDLKSVEKGTAWNCFSDVFGKVAGVLVQRPVSYRSKSGEGAVSAAVGREDGHLFLLENCCLFINRPLTFISFEDVLKIGFHRLQFCNRFDIQFVTEVEKEKNTIMFSNIEKAEFNNIFKFLFTTKKLKVINGEKLALGDMSAGENDGEEEALWTDGDNDDAEFVDLSGSDSDDHVLELDEGNTRVVFVGQKRRASSALPNRRSKKPVKRMKTRAKQDVSEVINVDSSDDDDSDNIPSKQKQTKDTKPIVVDLDGDEDEDEVYVPLANAEVQDSSDEEEVFVPLANEEVQHVQQISRTQSAPRRRRSASLTTH